VVPGEVVVGFLPGVSDEHVKSVADQLGALVGGHLRDGNCYLIKFKTDEAADRAVEVLNQDKTKYQIYTAFRNRRVRIPEPISFPPQKGGVPRIRFAHGLISVDVENVPLRSLLGEVSRVSGVSIAYIGSERVDPKVSARFQDLPLEEGIKRLLRDSDYLLIYEPSPPRLVKAIVRLKDNSKSVTPSATQEKASEKAALGPDGTAQLVDPSAMGEKAESRFIELRALGQEERSVERPEALEILTEAAFDTGEANLRIAAMEVLSQRQLQDPKAADVLIQAATHEEARVRMTAIEALGSIKEGWAIGLLEQAANADPEEAIRERARELLEGLQQ
jgi:hypothetical protein